MALGLKIRRGEQKCAEHVTDSDVSEPDDSRDSSVDISIAEVDLNQLYHPCQRQKTSV